MLFVSLSQNFPALVGAPCLSARTLYFAPWRTISEPEAVCVGFALLSFAWRKNLCIVF